MALLCAGVDSDRIRLLGRWRSDEMYRYLHVQAQPVMTAGLSAAMLRGGSFRIHRVNPPTLELLPFLPLALTDGKPEATVRGDGGYGNS